LKAETDNIINSLIKNNDKELNKHMIKAMAKLMRLKQACCHNKIIKKKMNDEIWEEFKAPL